MQINRQLPQFGVEDIHMACMTLANAQANYHISHFHHWNQKKADTEQDTYIKYFSWRYVINDHNLLI
jgi:hypothetical protein